MAALEVLALNTTVPRIEAPQAGDTYTMPRALAVQGVTVGIGAGTGADNTAVGASALAANTTGASNTALGRSALDVNTTGASNTAIGHNALGANTTASNNTAVGADALLSNTTGSSNVAVGEEASANTTGSRNVAIGHTAMRAVGASTASDSVFIGHQAGYYVSSSTSNIGIGSNALRDANTGGSNIAIGSDAGVLNTTGNLNVFVGVTAGKNNVSGVNNTAVGHGALLTASGSGATNNHVAIGAQSLAKLTTGEANSAVGFQALNATTTGTGNVAFGNQAMVANLTGSRNTAIGSYSADANRFGDNNTVVGFNAAYIQHNGSDNVIAGYQAARGQGDTTLAITGISNTGSAATFSFAVQPVAIVVGTTVQIQSVNPAVWIGYYVVTGSTTSSITVATTTTNAWVSGGAIVAGFDISYSAIIGTQSVYDPRNGADGNSTLGYRSGYAITTGANNTLLGREACSNLTTGSDNTFVGRGTAASAVGVSSELVIGQGLTGKGTQTAFVGGTSGAYNAKNVTTWETTSDERIKKNVADNSDGIDKIAAIRVRSFEYRSPDEITELPASAAVARTGVQIGVIAQELRAVLPECVTEAANGMLSVSTDPLVWYLINAVQTLSAKVAQLEAERTAQ
jgi:hypothetical protein